jgi:hypothetical protein
METSWLVRSEVGERKAMPIAPAEGASKSSDPTTDHVKLKTRAHE